jgi:hypothetical protein
MSRSYVSLILYKSILSLLLHLSLFLLLLLHALVAKLSSPQLATPVHFVLRFLVARALSRVRFQRPAAANAAHLGDAASDSGRAASSCRGFWTRRGAVLSRSACRLALRRRRGRTRALGMFLVNCRRRTAASSLRVRTRCTRCYYKV